MKAPAAGLACALLLAGCMPTSVSPSPLLSATSRLVSWPPFPNRGPAPGVTIEERERVVVVKNEADRSYWVAPATIELWEGGTPWVEADPGDGSRELRPGDAIERDIGEGADTVRVGVRLWPNATTAEPEEPWFVWLEVAGTG